MIACGYLCAVPVLQARMTAAYPEAHPTAVWAASAVTAGSTLAAGGVP